MTSKAKLSRVDDHRWDGETDMQAPSPFRDPALRPLTGKRRMFRRSIPFWLAFCLLVHLRNAAAAPFPIAVQLDWKPTAQFAGILVAQARGFYGKEGLRVSIAPAEGTMETVALVAQQPAAIGVTEADVLAVERAKGYRVKAFATMLQSTPFALFTLKTSNLRSMKDLKGKRIGLHGDGMRAIDVLLNFNGMSRGDVTLVDVPYSLDPLVLGQVDAMQGYVIDEGVRLEMEHQPVNVIPMSANGYTSYAEVLFAPEALLNDHPREVTSFLRATRRGWDYAIAHPDETARLIVKRYLPGGSIEEQRRSLGKTISLLDSETSAPTSTNAARKTADNSRFGMMQQDNWSRTLTMFHDYQLANSNLNAADLVDYSILDRLYGRSSR